MRDPQTPHHLHIRVAHILARYLHRKLSSGGTANDDLYGFVVDPAVARALRDDHLKLERTYFEERKPLEARVAQIAQKLKCPAGYTALEARRDHKRLQELRHKADSPPYRLGKKDDAEEAHLTARIAAYDQSDQKRAQVASQIGSFAGHRSNPHRRRKATQRAGEANLNSYRSSTLICPLIPMRCLFASHARPSNRPIIESYTTCARGTRGTLKEMTNQYLARS